MKRKETGNFDTTWMDKYKRLLAFFEREGHCRVPARYVEQDGFKLGIWVKAQREKQRKLSSSRREALDRIPGWYWRGQDAKWERGFVLLEQYVKREGHSRVPKLHIEEGYRLGVWVMHQRGAYKQGRLSSYRQNKLDGLPAWFWSYGEALPTRINVTRATKVVWRGLVGKPEMTTKELIDEAAQVLHRQELIYSDQLAADSGAMEDLLLVVQKMRRKGYIDESAPGHVRIVVRQPHQFRPEYWHQCLLNSCAREVLPRDDLLVNAAHWARDNLGLELKQFRLKGRIARELKTALDQALKNGELVEAGNGAISRAPRA